MENIIVERDKKEEDSLEKEIEKEVKNRIIIEVKIPRQQLEKIEEVEKKEIQKHVDIKKIKWWKFFEKSRLKLLKKAELNPRYFEELKSIESIDQQKDQWRENFSRGNR